MTTIDAHAHVFPRIRGRIGDGPVVGLQYGRAAVGDGSVQILPPLNAHVVHNPLMLIAAMDLVGVDRAVLLQGPFYGYCNTYVNAAATEYRDRFAAAIASDPWKDGRRGFEKACKVAAAARAFKLEFSERTGLSGLYRGALLGTAELAWLWEELDAAPDGAGDRSGSHRWAGLPDGGSQSRRGTPSQSEDSDCASCSAESSRC